ncbi:MAG: RNA polymerase sigma factor [Candidatus Eisenbacteria bacterium]|nr:sigma-70 family RNA polymerase sigma factor [Candidatus Eisenbacteria bacterium]
MRTDAELASAFRDGDDRAFAILYDRYKGPLFVFACKMLGNEERARDLVQDVFLSLYEKRLQLARPESFRSWLFASGRNRCLSQLRRTDTDSPLDDGCFAVPIPASMLPDARLEAGEEMRRLRHALARLRPEYREVLVLREYEDMSYQEIARITETAESVVRSRLFKARKALHDALVSTAPGGR